MKNREKMEKNWKKMEKMQKLENKFFPPNTNEQPLG